jgi:hypothetical protein
MTVGCQEKSEGLPRSITSAVNPRGVICCSCRDVLSVELAGIARMAMRLVYVTLLDLESVELLGDIGRLSVCGCNIDDLCERLLIKGGKVVLGTVCESQDRWPHSLRDTRIARALREKAIAATTVVGAPDGDGIAASACLRLHHDSTGGTAVTSDYDIPAGRNLSEFKTVKWASR